MKEMKRFILTDLIIGLLKVLVSFICRSYAVLESALYDLENVLVMLFNNASKKDIKKGMGIVTALINFLVLLGSIALIYISFVSDIKKPSLFLILFVLLFIIVKYAVSCLLTNITYQKKKGVISIATSNSSIDFYNYGIILLAMLVSKFSKWVSVLKYADRVAVILIGGLVLLKALKNIVNSFKTMIGKNIDLTDEYKKEITDRSEIKALDNIDIKYFGGYRYVICDVAINETISMIDINTFMVTMSDYLLKVADVAIINMTNGTRKVKTVKRVKANAGNSRGRNSKTNTKKKNTKKTNKKR